MKPIVINTPTFDEKNGGAIALHYLVDRLRNMGIDAYVYPMFILDKYPKWTRLELRTRLKIFCRNSLRRINRIKPFRTHPSMNTPVASKTILADSITVYPEIVSGNPLKARHVVRWLLHKPGFFRKDIYFGANELTFFYQDAFRAGYDWVDPDNLLRLRWIRDDIYFDKGNAKRQGACRLIRKGQATAAEVPGDDDAIVIDGMSHEETAEIFNSCKYLYCHDPYTMYSLYAAVCGCIPIVIPEPGLSRVEWRATYPFKHGIAYGMEEAGWAAETRDGLLKELAAQQLLEDEMLRSFVKKIDDKYRIFEH